MAGQPPRVSLAPAPPSRSQSSVLNTEDSVPADAPLRPRAGGWCRSAGLLLLLATAPGCVGLDRCWPSKDAPPRPGQACQVLATWSNKVHFAPDPANGGVPTPGILGRMYLFGTTIDFPQVGDGSAVVEL